jgi:hypothetical protein
VSLFLLPPSLCATRVFKYQIRFPKNSPKKMHTLKSLVMQHYFLLTRQTCDLQKRWRIELILTGKKKTQNKPTNERTQNAKRRKRTRASSLAQSEPSLCVHNSHEPRSEPTSKPRKLAWSMTWYLPNLPVTAAASSKVPMFSRFGVGSDQVIIIIIIIIF